MALTYGFYNSIEGDRVYDAIQFGRIFDGIIKDGVYATYEKGMMVIASSNPAEVIIQPGRAWFNHTWSYNDANVIFEAPAPEVLLERIDALVLEINEELSSRENSFKWVQGTPSSRPERPTLTNTSTIHQYPLCYVHRYPETTMIYTRDITNAIGTSECPFATGVLEGIDLDAWINQWDDEFHNWENTTKTGFETWMLNQEQVYTTWFNNMHSQMDTDLADFEAWFETIQGIIDEEAALHLQQEIDELRQEATSGSRIFVHTINESLFGKNVTITEAGGTVFASRFDNTGVAEFKSIPYVGNLTIVSTDGVQTATSVVNTPYYARYNFTIAFWAATVNIVGDPEMSGSTVTVRDSNEILVGTVVLNSEGTGIFTATAPDTYKFTLTYGGETMEVTLSVTQETTYTVDLHAAGFKWQDWLEAGGVTGSYSSLDDVLADEVALRRLFTVHASVDYMADISDENEDVEKIIGTDLAAKWINLRDYALDTLYANEIIAGYMDTADKYGYGEWCLMPQVPNMTSNNAPYGTAFASTAESSYPAYMAFDGNDSSYWSSTGTTNQYVGYSFASPIKLGKVKIIALYSSVVRLKNFKIQGSNDGFVNDVNDLYTGVYPNTQDYELNVVINADQAYTDYRLYAMDTYGSANYIIIKTLQFYAYAPKGNVPIMTANNAPYGEASASHLYSSSYPAYAAFDGTKTNFWAGNGSASGQYIQYKFVHPVIVKAFDMSVPILNNTGQPQIAEYTISGSNDGNTFTPLGTFTRDASVGEAIERKQLNNTAAYLYYRLTVNSYNSNPAVYTLQFYGRELSVSVPKMDTNTTPYGEADGTTLINSDYYYAFNNGNNPARIVSNGKLWYRFTNKVVAKMFTFMNPDDGTYDIPSNFYIIGSNDGENFERIATLSNVASATLYVGTFENATSYKYYGVEANGVNNNYDSSFRITHLQFYGLDYSEKEFEEGVTKKWLYDHGVELETMQTQTSGTGAILTKEDSHIYLYKPSNGKNAYFYFPTLDITDYDLLRGKLDDMWYEANESTSNTSFKVSNLTTADMATLLFHGSKTNFPNNLVLDVSTISGNISQGYYVAVMTGGGGTVSYFSINELWLE